MVYEVDGEIKGFVSFSANSYSMMKRFIFQSPRCLLILTLNTLFRPGNIERFVEAYTVKLFERKLYGYRFLSENNKSF